MVKSRPRGPLSLWLAALVTLLTLSGALLIVVRPGVTVAVYTARRDLPAFATVTNDDVRVATAKRSEATDPAGVVVGRFLTRPVKDGAVVGERDLLGVGAGVRAPAAGDLLVGAPATSAQAFGGNLVSGTVVRVVTTSGQSEEAEVTVLALVESKSAAEPPYVLVTAVPVGRSSLAASLANGEYRVLGLV